MGGEGWGDFEGQEDEGAGVGRGGWGMGDGGWGAGGPRGRGAGGPGGLGAGGLGGGSFHPLVHEGVNAPTWWYS